MGWYCSKFFGTAQFPVAACRQQILCIDTSMLAFIPMSLTGKGVGDEFFFYFYRIFDDFDDGFFLGHLVDHMVGIQGDRQSHNAGLHPLISTHWRKVNPGISPLFFNQKMEQKDPEKKYTLYCRKGNQVFPENHLGQSISMPILPFS
jgi:hypothetical protein